MLSFFHFSCLEQETWCVCFPNLHIPHACISVSRTIHTHVCLAMPEYWSCIELRLVCAFVCVCGLSSVWNLMCMYERDVRVAFLWVCVCVVFDSVVMCNSSCVHVCLYVFPVESKWVRCSYSMHPAAHTCLGLSGKCKEFQEIQCSSRKKTKKTPLYSWRNRKQVWVPWR